MDTSQYLEIFIDETKEHLQSLSDHFMVLEKEPDNADTINEIFRSAHTLKGMAGTMGFVNMQNLTHKMEDVFSVIRDGNMKVTPDLVDLLFRGLDALEAYQDNIINTSSEGDETNDDIVNALIAMKEGKAPDSAPNNEKSAEPAPASADGAPAASSSDGGDDAAKKYLDITYVDFEKNAIKEAEEQNKNVYGITVYIQENCLLKAARAFLVFKELEVLGEVVKSVPTVQDIEDEKFDLDFSVTLITDASEKEVVSAIKTVSEIEKVTIGKLNIPEIVNDGASKDVDAPKADDSAAPKKEETSKPAAAAAKKAKEDKKAPAKSSSKPVVNRSVRVDIEKLDDLMNQVSELIIAKNGLVSVSESESAATDAQSFTEQIEYLERITTTLHESIMKVRMVPIESVVNRFPRMIRDLSKKLDKPMELYMSGEDTELDRTVIDEIGDPLMHLLRNSADHGIESVERRRELGKPEQGSVWLNASQVGNNVVIEVKDDGGGIDVEKVRTKAIERGTITEEQAEAMEDKDIIDLLFLPSFSTAEKITDVSGRGVGLDVVKTMIEKLNGTIQVTSEHGKGSKFSIRLPLTLAIIQGLLVRVGREVYSIPIASVIESVRVKKSEINTIDNHEVLNVRNEVISVLRLSRLFNIRTNEDGEYCFVVIVGSQDKKIGVMVDNLIGEEDVVIKPLRDQFTQSPGISGASILGDGSVSLIIDVTQLLELGVRQEIEARQESAYE